MKKLIPVLLFSLYILSATAQGQAGKTATPDPNKKLQVVEASCGQCKLGLPGKSCDLAVRIDGKSYFVDGTDINSHGDAHAQDGFCEWMRMAAVQGAISNNRFKATYFKLVNKPVTAQPEKTNKP